MNSVLFQLNSSPNQDQSFNHGENTVLFNMDGEYTYLSEGYYRSLDAQIAGKTIYPTVEDILDAYVCPLAMEKARMNHLPVPDYKIVNDCIGIRTPIIAYPINPFSERFELITNNEEINVKMKALTLSGKYAVIIQSLPRDDYRIDTMRCILGNTLAKEYKELAANVFKIFKIPLMKVKVIVTSCSYFFSSIGSLRFEELTLNEKKMIEGMGTWQK